LKTTKKSILERTRFPYGLRASRLNEKTRGYIESMMDGAFDKAMTTSIEWVKSELPVSSFRDLVLGHVIGFTEAMCFAMTTVAEQSAEEEDKEIIRTMIRRRIPEIVQQIERELNR